MGNTNEKENKKKEKNQEKENEDFSWNCLSFGQAQQENKVQESKRKILNSTLRPSVLAVRKCSNTS